MPGKKSKNTIPTSLEKAEERIRKPVAQVPDEVIAGIKNAQQIQQETTESQVEQELAAKRAQTRNKALFFTGVFLGVGALFLMHRYMFSDTQYDVKYVADLANGTVATVTDQLKQK
jgi:uncharacterized membrane protein